MDEMESILRSRLIQLYHWFQPKIQLAYSSTTICKDLQTNPRNQRISLVPQFGFLIDRTDMYPGLTRWLKKNYWPDLDADINTNTSKGYFQAIKKRKITGNVDIFGKPSAIYKPSRTKKHTGCKLMGKAHGTIVHGELSTFIQCCYLDKSSSSSEKEEEDLIHKLARPDPCTLAVLYSLASLGWIPYLSEFQIFHEEMKIATAVDLIVYDERTKQRLVVEMKINFEYEHYEELPEDPFIPQPFRDIQDCPKNRHLLQLLFCTYILETKYNFKPDRCVVLRRQSRGKCTNIIDLDMKWAREKYNSFLF